ncbi:hypothetical protein HZU38_05465 [Mycolicibacterium vanbaalenii]|uniref:hypothetical protein n=1 Tax=Mycolicibacterium vanbaalenii TaxID=110539 RepID=UPI001F3D59EA|nr:hypothetical protein [Mycolicibacterium vanbaalenii]UJL29950.1 hypothetical protein HZU38_05465 [Mycolicibacterium vanbaalenii]WND56989.1 hypothetical protein QQA43_00805 [Mycolicibacterium vanbaalenii]
MKFPNLTSILDGLDVNELNPIRCCVCVALGHRDSRVATVVRGYAVCLDHIAIDEHLSLRSYVDAITEAFDGGAAR